MSPRPGGHLFAMRQTRGVSRWVCPRCDREFGVVNQAHTCVPGISVDELLSRHPAWVGDVYRALVDHLRTLGPIHEDAVDVGVFLKSDRSIAEFRPQVRAVKLWIVLPVAVDDARLTRVAGGGTRIIYHAKLGGPDDVDEQLCGWLGLAYDFATNHD
jgi:Domain of unknown function (DUF5655)